MSDHLSSNEIAEPRVSVTLTAEEFQALMDKERVLRAEIAEGNRINAEAVNEWAELQRQLYALTQEPDALRKWKELVLKAIGPEEQPVETSAPPADPL